jgi:type II secretory pathway pseudopilin PulG
MRNRHAANFNRGPGRQRGGALFVMLVILIIGAAALLVSALNSSSAKSARDKTTAAALAQAKEALIAYAVNDANRPGELPCPDFNNDGPITPSEDYSGSNCLGLVGWLPWKSLGLPDLRDGNGDRLWYVVANPFHANGTAVLNSDTPSTYLAQMLTLLDSATGATLQSGVIAIVFSPGAPLQGQARSPNDNNATTAIPNYLEADNANLNTTFQTANNNQVPVPTPAVNDRLLTIDSRDLFPPVEKRIARETKACLDNYAASSNSRYPWAADDNDTTYTGNYNTFFGRIPAVPITTTQSIDPYGQTMLTALSSLQSALNAYSANTNATTTSALLNAGLALISAAQNADNNSSSSFYGYNSITGNADSAGDHARDLANGVSGVYTSTVQNSLNSTNYNLNSSGFIDGTMSNIWPSSCVFSSKYWSAWQNEVFFQLASGNRPGSPVSTCNTTCLTINGSGSLTAGSPTSPNGTYRAAVIVGRAHNGSGSVTSDPPSYYLEGDSTSNLHSSLQTPSTSPAISTTFVTYRPGDPGYASNNDLVVCLDGNIYCK